MLASRRQIMQGTAAIGASCLLPSCGAGSEGSVSTGESYLNSMLPLPDVAGFTKAGTAAEGDVQRYADQIGRGFDSVFDESRRYFVEGEMANTLITPHPDYLPNTLKYELVENQSQYRAVISRSAKAKGRYGIFKARGGGSSQTEKTNNSYSLRVCAVAKKFGPAITLKNGTTRLSREAIGVIRTARNNKNALLLGMGDNYISGILPASELFIDIIFETSSSSSRRALKASISGSFGRIASGSGSYSELIGSARSYKRVVIELTGINGVSREFSPDNAWSMIENFYNDTTTQAYAAQIFRREVSELVVNNQSVDWVDVRARAQRENFVSEAEASLLYLANGRADAEYVAANVDEFAAETIERAQADLQAIQSAEGRIIQAGAEARLDFDESGSTTAKFDPARIADALPTLKGYLQKEPTPAPASTPAPRPKPPREPRDRPSDGCRGPHC